MTVFQPLMNQEPIAFAKQPGNVHDIFSVENVIRQMESQGIVKPLTVTDAGYCSEHNLMEYAKRNMKFLIIVDTSKVWIRNIIDNLTPHLQKTNATCPFDISIRGAVTAMVHNFAYCRQRNRNGVEAGTPVSFQRRLYVYVFKSEQRKIKREEAFTLELLELKKQLEDGQTDFTDSAENKIKKYLIQSKAGRDGVVKIMFNGAEISKESAYFGYFVLVSNQFLEIFQSLEYYRLREKVEELFAGEKGSFDGKKPRIWYPDNLRGRQFAQFTGLVYQCFIMRKIREVRQNWSLSPQIKLNRKQNREKTSRPGLTLILRLKSWTGSTALKQQMCPLSP